MLKTYSKIPKDTCKMFENTSKCSKILENTVTYLTVHWKCWKNIFKYLKNLWNTRNYLEIHGNVEIILENTFNVLQYFSLFKSA